MNVLLLMIVSGVISPVITPSATRQYFGSPSHPSRDLPSNMERNPGSSPDRASGRSLCLGTYVCDCCARSRKAAASDAARSSRRVAGFMPALYIAASPNHEVRIVFPDRLAGRRIGGARDPDLLRVRFE